MHVVQCMGVSVATAYRSLLDLRKRALNLIILLIVLNVNFKQKTSRIRGETYCFLLEILLNAPYCKLALYAQAPLIRVLEEEPETRGQDSNRLK
jgi:hypothetical protein